MKYHLLCCSLLFTAFICAQSCDSLASRVLELEGGQKEIDLRLKEGGGDIKVSALYIIGSAIMKGAGTGIMFAKFGTDAKEPIIIGGAIVGASVILDATALGHIFTGGRKLQGRGIRKPL